MWHTVSRPHFLSGGSCWWFLRPGHAGDDITIQELHPDCDWCRRGAALPDGFALRKVHQTCHSGAEGQVDPAHSGVRTHPQEKTTTTEQNLHLHLLPLFTALRAPPASSHSPLQFSSPFFSHYWNDITHNPTAESGLDQWLTCSTSTWGRPTLQEATPTVASSSSSSSLPELHYRAPGSPAVSPRSHLM